MNKKNLDNNGNEAVVGGFIKNPHNIRKCRIIKIDGNILWATRASNEIEDPLPFVVTFEISKLIDQGYTFLTKVVPEDGVAVLVWCSDGGHVYIRRSSGILNDCNQLVCYENGRNNGGAPEGWDKWEVYKE